MNQIDAQPLAPGDIERIVAETFVRRVDWRDEAGSTNDLALELAARADVETPLLLGATLQTAGRGRGANRWWSSAGSLTFSLLLESAAVAAPAQRLAHISLTAALAVCEALQSLVPEAKAGLKWPNDVCLNGRKACGILVEIPPQRPVRAVVGVGLNVNNSLASAPLELRNTATSLSDETGRRFNMAHVLLCVLKRLGVLLAASSVDQFRLADRWRPYCVLSRRHIHLSAGAQTIAGVCQGIDDQGALLLQTPAGQQRCFAGVVAKVE